MAETVTVKVDTAGIDHLLKKLPTEGDMLVQKAAEDVVAFAQTSMVGGGSPHVPSAPGEPPHMDTGALSASVHVHPKERELERDVGDGVEYGLPLELGTSRMAARPWLFPALTKAYTPFLQAWRQFIERG